MKDLIYQLRIYLAYFVLPKGVRTYLIKALSYKINDLEKDTEELLKQMNVEAQRDDKEMDEYMRELSRQITEVTQTPMEEVGRAVHETMTAYAKANIKPFIQTEDLKRPYLSAGIKRGIKSKKKRGIK